MYNGPLVFKKPDGGIFKIDHVPLQKIREYLQVDKEKNEAGGVLLGRHIIDSNDIVVDDITTPMQNDVRRRHYFLRLRENHQMVVTEKWIKSNGTCNYLGEWHTHPDSLPTPSLVDIREWIRLLKSTRFDGENLYFIISGTMKIKVWEGNRANSTIKQLEEIVKLKGGRHEV